MVAKNLTKEDVHTRELALIKLESSGLTVQDAVKLKMVPLTRTETGKLHPSFGELASLKLNYCGPDGKPLSDWPGCKAFYRLRYLERGTGFADIAGKEIRYVQEPFTAPVAYYPTNYSWLELIKDTNKPVIITEGELKAAKACKEGFPTIGLGGVHNWRSMKLGIEWIDSLSLVDWRRRNVYICFDSDYQTNENVCNALRLLAEELQRRGSYCFMVTLPQVEVDEKVGLDDFFIANGPEAPAIFQDLLSNAEPLGLCKVLWAINDRYTYVENPGFVINRNTNTKIQVAGFTNHVEATENYQERRLKADGSISYKAVSAAQAWVKWPLRSQAAKLTYAPGSEKFIPSKNGILLNVWPGWGVEPEWGDIVPFLDLVTHIFKGAEPKAMEWFLRWCAYPLQNPGVKQFSSIVLHGIRHGTGKSLLGYTMGRIYGQNFTEISQMDLHNSFNEWAEGRQMVMGDDVTGSNKRQDADFLKKLITQREIRVNTKFVPTYVVPDCINYFFTANHPDSFFLEDDDRRFFIHEVLVGPLEELFYMEYELWLDTGGSNAVFHYLKNLDMGDYNPAAPAFRTAAKERMISNVQSDLASWVRLLRVDFDNICRIGNLLMDKDLFTSKELLSLYDPSGHTGTTANGLGREMARAGFRQVCEGKPLKTADGHQARFYVVRNQELWGSDIQPKTAIEHVDKWLKGGKGSTGSVKKIIKIKE